MKICLRVLFLLFFLCECFFVDEANAAHDKKILILHSYHQEYPWTKNQYKGFIQTLDDSKFAGEIKISTEHLDTKRVDFSTEYQIFFYQYLKNKYKNYSPDIIFCTDDNALSFLMQFKNSLFGNSPVVFCGVNNVNVQNKLDRKEYTGVFEKKEFSPNMALIEKTVIKPGKILFIGDNSSTFKSIEKQVRKDLERQKPSQEFEFLASNSLIDISQQLKLKKTGIIFLTTIGGIKDENNEVVPLKKTLRAIVNSGKFIIISMEDVYLQDGILGGYVTSGLSQGEKAANQVLKIFKGESPASIPLLTKSPNKYMFNYPQLKKIGLSISQLPEDTVIYNRPPSFYEIYKYRIWLIMLFLGLQTIIIIYLIYNIQNRRKAEFLLKQSEKELSQKVEERTGELTKTNKNLKNEIQERKQADKSLESQNQLMSTLLENLKVGVFMVEAPSGKPLLANQAAKQMLGRGIIENTDKLSIAEIYQAYKSGTGELYPQAELPIVRGLKGESHSIDDMIVVQPDGQKVYLEVFGSPVKNRDGEVILSLVSFLDITDRKKAEEKLLKEEKFTYTALDSQQDTFFLFEPISGKPIRWNKALSEMTGYSDEEIAELKAPNSYYSEEDLKRAAVFVENVIETGFGTIELELICKDGRKVPTEYNVSLIDDEDGAAKYLIAIGRDLTERRQMEDELRQAHKMESIGTLAGGIAHDFNNILGIIVGNAELALDDLPDRNPSHNYLNEIKIASLRAKDVVMQLLSFSRKTDQEQKPLDIKNVIKESIKLIRASIPSNIEIYEEIPEKIDVILADGTQIHQVMINLCTNASHAMEKDRGLLEIILRPRVLKEKSNEMLKGLPPGNYVELIVRDSGSGIDPQIHDRIFDPYFTTKEVGKGTGMGLAVVHGIVKNHRGGIYVDSESGKGTTFRILFPAITEQPQQTAEASPVELNPTGKETILFVDDEEAIVDLTRMILEKLGYLVQAYTNPAKALAIFEEDPTLFDLVISDMTMPQMSGVQLSEELRKIQNDIPIIICTGNSSLIDEEKVKEIGVSAFAMKPITMSEIAQLIRDVLDK